MYSIVLYSHHHHHHHHHHGLASRTKKKEMSGDVVEAARAFLLCLLSCWIVL